MSEVDAVTSIKKKIYGDVLVSNNIGASLRKWRRIFKITQVELANHMGVSASVVSEYENDPTKSPGSRFLKRYVDSLVEIDMRRGGKIISLLSSIDLGWSGNKAILRIKDFYRPIDIKRFIEALDAEIIVGKDRVNETNLYGYTIIDGVAAILSMSGESYYKIFGRSTERALIFLNISTGRSPLVAVRVYPLKPRMVVVHGPKKMDALAIKIAEKEHIILGISRHSSQESLISSLVKNIDENFKDISAVV